jgi:hypothetical protein
MLKVALLAVFSVVAVAYGSSPTAPGHALAARSYHLDANPEAAALLHGGVLTEQAKAATAQALTTTEGEAPSVTAASATAKPSLKGKKGKVNVPKADGARSAAELEAMLGNNNSPSAVRRMDLSKIRDAVVQIVCAHSAFNWKRPWQSASESEGTCSLRLPSPFSLHPPPLFFFLFSSPSLSFLCLCLLLITESCGLQCRAPVSS